MENIKQENIESAAKTPIFSYEFPDKKSVEINENKEGEVDVFIKNESGQKIFDFASLLPPEFKFVNHKLMVQYDSRLAAIQPGLRTHSLLKLIEIDGVDQPQLILGILHEIGHANCDPNSIERKRIHKLDALQKFFALLKNKQQFDWFKELIRLKSAEERRAWAYALRTAKELQKKFEIDLKSLFSGFSDLKKFIDSYLSSYSEVAAKEILYYDPAFEKDLKKLFDRWQYKIPEAAKTNRGN